jgi:[ribosomal protein S18]-alanine N-acetyltransferase
MKLGGWFRRDTPARVLALSSRHASRLADIHGTAFTRPWDALEFERCLADRGIFADGVFLRGRSEPVGFVLSRRVGDEAEILSVAMAPEARGFGYARPLLEHHLQTLAQAGVRDVFLEVEEGNRPARALYRGHGFREIGRRAGYYARPDGTRAAAITMGRTL